MARRIVRSIPLLAVHPVEIPKSIEYETYKDYLASPIWAKLRKQAVERDGYRCRVCNSSKKLDVHHRLYAKIWGEEEATDLTTLCSDCHELFSLKKKSLVKTPSAPRNSKKKTKNKNPGAFNSWATRILYERGFVTSLNTVPIKETAKIICSFRGDPFPENGDKGLCIKIIRDFCQT